MRVLTVHHIRSHSKLWPTYTTVTTGLEMWGTSEFRNLKNPAISSTTTKERNIPEVICKVCLAGGRDHRRKPSEAFLIDEARPGQASESSSGPTHCKQRLMEGSNPGTHMNGCRQTHTYELLNVNDTHRCMHKGRKTHSHFSQFTFPAAYLDTGQSCCLEV